MKNCYLDALEEGAGCILVRSAAGDEMGLNEFGQETSGKASCLELTRGAGGDTFVYSVGLCEVYFDII